MTTTQAQRSQWTTPGSDASAQKTYASVRSALAKLIEQRSVEVFLQGSYANHTNVRNDSDVDVVVMTRQTFSGNSDGLLPTARRAWDALPPATYHENDLRRDVEIALSSYYGASRVHPRNKCITVDGVSGYVDGDVVPCFQYRHFENSFSTSTFIEGIRLYPREGGSIINFPKQHIKNGEAKNAQCVQRYKPTVRQVKRLRNYAVSIGLLRDGEAPGYLLECMIFNAPPDLFVSDDSDRLVKIIAWLLYADKKSFQSCDRVHHLFIDDPGQFNVASAQHIVNQLWEAI